MDIGHGHEDRDLQHLLLQVFGFLHDLRHDHAAVAGRENQVGIVYPHTAGFPEKRDDKEPKQQQSTALTHNSEIFESLTSR